MTPDNDHHLRFKHPVLFAQPSGPQTSCFALDGFAVGDGWGAILDALATEIERLCAIKGRPLPPVLQVKEKFGLLRIYVGKNEEDIRAAPLRRQRADGTLRMPVEIERAREHIRAERRVTE